MIGFIGGGNMAEALIKGLGSRVKGQGKIYLFQSREKIEENI